MPYMKKPLCRSCGECMPGVNLLMLCTHCRKKLREEGEVPLRG